MTDKYLIQVTDEELELLNNHRRKKAAEWKPRIVELIPVEEKVKGFDLLYQQAVAEYDFWKVYGHSNKNAKQRFYEIVMELLDGGNMWDRLAEFSK